MPYFQPVIDAIRAQPHAWLDLVLELCEAVEAENGPRIVLHTLDVVKTVQSRMPPIEDLPPEVFYETMARLLILGEYPELEALVEWYEPLTIISRSRNDRITQNWIGAAAFIEQPPPQSSDAKLEQHWNRYVGALRYVLAAHKAAVAALGPPPRVTPQNVTELAGGFGTASFGRPTRAAGMERVIERLVWAWMGTYQQRLDAGLRHLDAKSPDRGARLKWLRERWLESVGATFRNKNYRASSRLQSVQVTLAAIQPGPPKHLYLDAFLPRATRQFGFKPYDRTEQDAPESKSVWLVDLLRRRESQLYFFLDQYGEFYADGGPPGAVPSAHSPQQKARKDRFKARRQLIDAVLPRAKSLHLKSEDDLVSFGCPYYEALLGGKKAQATAQDRSKAWEGLLEFFQLHLKTQTVHTEFNLDEKPSYFDRAFPRAIDGGELLDCGVYAVRLAFVFLSLTRCVTRTSPEASAPKVTFLMLPLHVGLIVEIDDLAPVVVHNNVLTWLTDEERRVWREEWDRTPDRHRPDPPDEAARNQKFLEDAAAQLFLRDVDLPLTRQPIKGVSVVPKKHEIWKVYERVVVPTFLRMFSRVVEDPRRKEYQFDLRFLEVLDIEKSWHDSKVVPFWNEHCHKAWNGVAGGDPARTEATLKQDPAKRDQYVDRLKALVAAMDKDYDTHVLPFKNELSKELRANKHVLSPKTRRVTTASRLRNAASGLGPVGQVRRHVQEVGRGMVPTPAFASEANFLTRIGR